ncbi:MAG: cation-translocating P-type ATPase [Thaumarchaeota archaeon]|nr:cation-translocating P-type ATPase [Nitrososphaerota archaeon]MDE1840864.1 cation-translocating P-type ATPase [Nitrososphaerota archaeon]MDE1877057.1 cation-translocating P-type ATPase [Nitrososphaerota archaeon]
MSGACEYDPKKAHELAEEPDDKRIEILRIVGIGLVTIFIAWLQIIQPDWIGKIIITITVMIGGYPLFKESLGALRNGRVNMELSMVIAIIASLALFQFLPAIVVTFFAIMSEFIEGFIVKKGRKNIEKLYSLAPRKALVKNDDGQTQSLEIEQVNVGNIIIVREGDVIPVDGVIISGSSTIDQSSITGESLPVEKKIGDHVFAGTINLTQQLEIRCEKESTDTTFAKIIQLVEEAEASKAPIQKLSDKMATRLIQFAIGLSVVTYLVTQNIVSTLSVIIVAGACGLAVGTPIALLATIGKISKHGIVIKGGLQIENLSRAGIVVFDKTGTLTHGKPVVSQVVSLDPYETPKKILEYAAMIEKNINHPLARAVEERAIQEGILISNESSTVSNMVTVGGGVRRIFNQQQISLGNLEFIDKVINDGDTEHASQRMSELLKSKRSSFQYLVNEYKDSAGHTLQIVRQQDVNLLQFALTATFLAIDRQLVGALFFEDSLRDDAKEAINKIKKMNIKVVMLTGDNEKIAKRIAEEVGIDEYYAELLPQDKVSKIEDIVKTHGKDKTVVMVGDGVNDAPALAKAHIGIAMGKTGTDVAIETADVVLMSEDLMKIPYLIKNSRQSIFAIKQNYFGTLGVDGFGFVLAFTGHINPLLAAAIHVSSELVFMVNSARLILDKQLTGAKP